MNHIERIRRARTMLNNVLKETEDMTVLLDKEFIDDLSYAVEKVDDVLKNHKE